MKFLQVEEPHKYSPGPVLLLAGPGSGKTHSLALRVKWLVEDQNVDPKTISVITFTTEAARNMRLRLSDEDRPDVYMPKDRQPEIISTMHSLGHRIIRRNLEMIGLKENFRVVTSDKLREVIFGDAAQLMNFPRNLGLQAMSAKMIAESMPAGGPNADICQAYSTILRACNSVDHDDQILLACDILQRDPALLGEYQGRAMHLLIDEYQDINAAQFELIRILSRKSQEGLYVVGDDDQSIYAFRGGSPQYVKKFEEHFGNAASILVLPYCRRCPPKVLLGALAVASKFNVGRLEKPPLSPFKDDQTSITVYDLPSDAREAALIAQICSKALPASDVLILVPNNKFAELATKALKKRGINYDFRPSIDDEGLSQVSRLFDFLLNPQDSLALRQCIHTMCDNGVLGIPGPLSKAGQKLEQREEALQAISKLWEVVLNEGRTLLESLKSGPASQPVLEAIRRHIMALVESYGLSTDVFLQTLGSILRPWNNPDHLAREVRFWVGELTGRGSAGEGVVRILSMWKAKGLEADHVVILGLEEGVFPGSTWPEDRIAEAARLFYVSMTRAKTHLYISHVRKRDAAVTFLRTSYGLKPSRFLGAIPRDCVQIIRVHARSQKKRRKSAC